MRIACLWGARAVLLGGPTALAFFAGGYFDEPRTWAGLTAWALVVVAAVADRRALPRGRPAAWACFGLLGLGVWTLASLGWAPIGGGAYHAGQIVFLYLGALLAATMLLGSRGALAWAEPALTAGTLIAIGYGVSERLLPGVLHFARSVSAQGRLEQPLTYWNAMGELAALGFVLSARLAGDSARAGWLRTTAAAGSVPLALGLYLSFSRGALFACVAGLVALAVAAPRAGQLRAIGLVVVTGVIVSAAVSPLDGVTSLRGGLGTREWQGAVALGVLVVLTAAAAVGRLALAQPDRDTVLRMPRRAPWIALGIICAGLAIAIIVGAHEGTSAPLSAGANRLVTLQSNRYAYWRVALKAFGHEPLHGVGAGGWSVWWLRYRTVNEFAQDAHSLPLQTLAELGLVGFGLLLAFLGGVLGAARVAYRRAPGLAAGAIAGCVVWLAHSPLDWDWQMPAVTLVAIGLAGALLALAGGVPAGGVPADGHRADAAPTAPRRSAAPRG